MENNNREGIQAVLDHYHDCQINGIKDVERQMEIYSEDSQFILFPVAGVVGISDPRVIDGKQAIAQLFEQYNTLAKTFDSVSIVNKHQMIDPEALKGSFAMEITMTRSGDSHYYFNYLQMQLNQDMQVISSMNWQADITGSGVLDYL